MPLTRFGGCFFGMRGSPHPGAATARARRSPRLCRPRTAGGRCPCASRGRCSAAGGVWRALGHRRGILRVPASAMETPSPPLASLVTRQSLEDALPCRIDREGFFIAAASGAESMYRTGSLHGLARRIAAHTPLRILPLSNRVPQESCQRAKCAR